MKTLDEVIKKIEACIEADGHCPACPYEVSESCGDMDADALFYLKEYRWVQENCADALAEKYPSENVPLTWDELKQMEGKPVWIEEIGQRYSSPHWMIHDGIVDAYDGDEILYLQPFETMTKYSLGKTWNAFRKERK